MPPKFSTADALHRCLAAAGLCVEAGNHRRANVFMDDQIRKIAREIATLKLSGEAKAALILRPMEEGLVGRYGPKVGRRLYWDFLESFWLQSWTTGRLTPPRPAYRLDSRPASAPVPD